MTRIIESIKKTAETAAQAAQKAMSDRPPQPVELGGIADKLPRPGAVIGPPPVNAPAVGGPVPVLSGGGQVSER